MTRDELINEISKLSDMEIWKLFREVEDARGIDLKDSNGPQKSRGNNGLVASAYGAPMLRREAIARGLADQSVFLVRIGDKKIPVLATLRKMLGKSLTDTMAMVKKVEAGESVEIFRGAPYQIRESAHLAGLRALGVKLEERLAPEEK